MRFNPFNPQQPARPDFFVGRVEELEKFEQNLLQTIHDSPMNMAITGNRGIGKTSTLIKFEEIAKRHNCLVVRLSNYEKNIKDVTELTSYLLFSLKNEFLATRPLEKNLKDFGDWVLALRPTVGYGDFSLTLQEKQSAAQSILRVHLEEFWNAVKTEFDAVVILIDEAESLEEVEGAMTFLREVFQRLSTNCRYSLVLCGKLNYTERMSESFSPLNRFFPDMKLDPFEEGDVREYILRKLKSVDVTIQDSTIKKIYEMSQGHPYVVAVASAGLFNMLKDNENIITQEMFDSGYPKIKYELEKDFFYPMYHPLTPKAKEILMKICQNIDSTEFTFNQATDITKMKRTQIAPYIQELVKRGIINKPRRAHYAIFHKMFWEFIRSQKTAMP